MRAVPGAHAEVAPDRPAVVMSPSGGVVSYAELEARSNWFAQLLRQSGLRVGQHIALFMENDPRYFEVVWAAQRAGLYYTPVNSYLAPEEVGYILEDCGAELLVTTAKLAGVASQAISQVPALRHRLMAGGTVEGFTSYEEALASQPTVPIDDEVEGSVMFYSSGTTGRPKGIRRPLPRSPFGETTAVLQMFQGLLGWEPGMTYLSPAPLYHSAPLLGCMCVHRLGGTAVVMERFDAEEALALVERHRVTHAQFVPTMFVRMLELDSRVRNDYDLSSLRHAVHAAAPCPVAVKEAMIEWWGPILLEYYAGTEGNGLCVIDSAEWLSRKGSVGRPAFGKIHVLYDEGIEVGPGQVGTIWFEGGPPFEYHNDPDKTRSSRRPEGWTTLWDMGYLDEEGFLYLTDRASFMIVSGGVNIYPQEIENVLVTHPAVADAAVLGVPNQDLGEEVKAVIQLLEPEAAGAELAEELDRHCREHLARFKCPRSFDFTAELPRLPTGKLYKHKLKDQYWGDRSSRII